MKNQIPDADLMEALKSRDYSALEPLMARHSSAVFGYCMRMLSGDRAQSEDITQEVWLKVVKNAPGYVDQGHFRAWLMTITRNSALTLIKKRIPAQSFSTEEGEEREFADDFNLEANFLEKQDLAKVKKAVEGLPDTQKVVLTLWLEDGASYEKIAGELGISEGTVRANLYRAKITLRRRLESR